MPKVTNQELEDLKRLNETNYPDNISLKTETSLLRRKWIKDSSSGFKLTDLGRKRLRDYLDELPVATNPKFKKGIK